MPGLSGLLRASRGRRSALFGAGTVLAVVVASVLAPSGAMASTAQPKMTAASTGQHGAETALAARMGSPVEVTSLRSEYETTYANPDGTFRLDQSVVPVRARGGDGAWHVPDATLVRRPDGSVGPRYAVVDIRLSGGGDAAMISIAKGGRSVDLAWPGTLPTPVLSGQDATYRDVLPGVDLTVTATTEGVRQVLVVRTRAAAADPRLRSLSFPVTGHGLRVRTAAGGGIDAVDANGVSVFAAPAGAMWDSTQPAGAAAARARSAAAATGAAAPAVRAEAGAQSGRDPRGAADLDAAHGPSVAARATAMPTRISGSRLLVTPDAAMLDAATTTYPVYIDPPMGINTGPYTVIRSDGWKSYKFGGDEGVGKCGSVVIGGTSYYCGPGYVNRMLFQFSGSSLNGKYVTAATFRVYEMWSFTCTPSITNLYRVNGTISSSTSWPGPATADKMGDRTVSAGRGTACSPEQPNAWIEFKDAAGETDENLTPTVRSLADGKWSSLALELRNNDEGDTADWKRFRGDAVLSVTYVPRPGPATGIGVKAGSSSAISCSTSSTAPTTVTTLTPTFGATPQALVNPKSGEELGSFAAQFGVYPASSSTATWTSPVATSGFVAEGTARTAVLPTANKLTEGTVYRVRARSQSHYSGGDLWGAYPSTWCYFRPITKAPPESVVTPVALNGVTYSECAQVCTANGGPGLYGSFKLTNTMTTVTSFTWKLVLGTKVVDSGTATATLSAGLMTATITARPQDEGVHELEVVANNPAGPSAPHDYDFSVLPGAAPIGSWQVADVANPGADSSAAAANPLTLNGDATASSLGRRAGSLDENGAARLDGALSFSGAGYASTAGTGLNTAGSFTVAAWAYLRSRGANSAVLSQSGGPTTPGFNVYYSTSYDKWIVNWTTYDAAGVATYQRALAKTAAPPLNAWTHLAGVYDAPAKTLELYVNGVPQGKTTLSTLPVAVPGALTVGRTDQGAKDYVNGMVDEVAAWDRALTATELARVAQTLDPATGAPATALVGQWSPTGTGGLTDVSGYGRSALTLLGGATTDPNLGLVLNGTTAGATAAGPLVDENASFTVTAEVSGMVDRASGKGRLVSQRNGVSGTGSSWSLYYDYVAKDWVFQRTGLNAAGTSITATATSAVMPPDPDADLKVTGVYDARDQSVQVIVMLAPQDCVTGCSQVFASGQGAGEVSVGTARGATAWADYLAGDVGWVRVWAGAMDPNGLLPVVYGD